MIKRKNIYDRWMKSFQSKVFFLEKTKFKIQDEFFPNYDKFIENYSRKKYDKKLEMANDEDKALIKAKQKQFLINIRKEKHRKENINYHFDQNYPEETIKWLNTNKKIHIKGLFKNAVLIPVFAILLGLSLTNVISLNIVGVLAGIGLGVQMISAFINTNCVLLQNYNIKRVQKYIDGPYKKRQEKLKQKAKDYSQTTKVVAKTIDESDTLPTIDEVINSLKTSEQARQLLELVNQELKYRQNGTAKIKKYKKNA